MFSVSLIGLHLGQLDASPLCKHSGVCCISMLGKTKGL